MKKLLLYLLTLFVFTTVKANAEVASDTVQTKKVDVGHLILSHVNDAYEWHIITIGSHHISIPLPVILFDSNHNLVVFMSSELHHGETMYGKFKISEDKKYEGKIVEVIPDGSEVRPWDFSITKNVLSLFIGILLIISIFIAVGKRYTSNTLKAPKGVQSWIEPIILFIKNDIALPSIGEKRHGQFLPYLLTLFFFILINNLLGLIPVFPGGANLTGNIAVTMVLALITFVITSVKGTKSYWLHLVNTPGVPWWLKFPIPLMPFVEILGVFIKPIVLMVRLFANITAGHIVALGFYSLIFVFGEKNIFAGYGVSVISVTFTIFMGLLELLVAFIQAYVFTLLSALYFGMAMEESETH